MKNRLSRTDCRDIKLEPLLVDDFAKKYQDVTNWFLCWKEEFQNETRVMFMTTFTDSLVESVLLGRNDLKTSFKTLNFALIRSM